jgi:hypothetical protein
MAALSDEQKRAMRKATEGMAEALLEDLEHFRAVVARPDTSRRELRLLSTSLRRLLVNSELREIAAPRIGKLELSAPDYHPLYEVVSRAVQVQFCGGCGTRVFGSAAGPFYLMRFKDPPPFSNVPEYVRKVSLPTIPFNPERRVNLRLDNFLTQKVICFDSVWISRGSIIKYVANFGSGAHSATPGTTEEKLISRLRETCAYHLSEKGIEFRLAAAFGNPDWDINAAFGRSAETPTIEGPFSSIDPALIELLSVAQLVSESPSVIGLEKMVRAELIPAKITRASYPH